MVKTILLQNFEFCKTDLHLHSQGPFKGVSVCVCVWGGGVPCFVAV